MHDGPARFAGPFRFWCGGLSSPGPVKNSECNGAARGIVAVNGLRRSGPLFPRRYRVFHLCVFYFPTIGNVRRAPNAEKPRGQAFRGGQDQDEPDLWDPFKKRSTKPLLRLCEFVE